MALYPGAVYKPTSWGGRTVRNRQGRGILHVAVSGARSLPPWSANTWHFYVAFDGYCEQYVDTNYRAATSGAANDDAIGIETAGGLGPSKVLNAEPWTPAQAERIADIMRWEAAQPGGAPLELLPDSKPGRRGWGPHRLGIEHSRGVGAVPGWLVPGGERWSSHLGKECPGDAKVAQIPAIVARARQAAGPNPAPTPVKPKLGDPDMRVLRTPEGSIWLATDLEVVPTSNGGLSGSAQKAWGSYIDVTREEVAELQRDAEQRRARLLKAVAAALPAATAGAVNVDALAGEVADKLVITPKA